MRPTPCRRAMALLLLAAFAAPLLSACGSSTSTGSPGGAVGNIVITDANNYTSTSSLAVPVVETAASDLTISWGGLAHDLLCHTAQSIDNVAFLKIGNMTQSQVEDKLAKGTLTSTQVTTYREFHTGGSATTSTMLSALSFGSALVPSTDYVVSPSIQYVLLFTHGTVLGVGAQTMVFISPSADPTITNTMVAAPDPCPASGSPMLTFAPTLSATPVTAPKNGPYKVDWSEVTKDNFGQTLDFSQTKLDKVELGFFAGKQPSDIQADFLNVETDATSLYTATVPKGNKYVDLTTATDPTGSAFSGFGATAGTWAVAVLCSTCSVPAPIIFSVLQPQ